MDRDRRGQRQQNIQLSIARLFRRLQHALVIQLYDRQGGDDTIADVSPKESGEPRGGDGRRKEDKIQQFCTVVETVIHPHPKVADIVGEL